MTQFIECFPPLRRAWFPVTESQVRWPLDGPIMLRAKADLVIGRSTGNESRKVLIDLKTGRIVSRFREDLRFYALVETLSRELPPRAVASFSLEAGEAAVENVTEAMLRSALRRTLDAISRIIELTIEGCSPKPPPSADCFRCRDAGGPRLTQPGVISATGRPEAGVLGDGGDRAARLDGRSRLADRVGPDAGGRGVEVLDVEHEPPEPRRPDGEPGPLDDLDDQPAADAVEPLAQFAGLADPLQRSVGRRGDRLARAFERVGRDDDVVEPDGADRVVGERRLSPVGRPPSTARRCR